jgi:hypothetical protein
MEPTAVETGVEELAIDTNPLIGNDSADLTHGVGFNLEQYKVSEDPRDKW